MSWRSQQVEELTAQLARLSTKNQNEKTRGGSNPALVARAPNVSQVARSNVGGPVNSLAAVAVVSMDGMLIDWNPVFGSLIGRVPAPGPSPLATPVQASQHWKAIQARGSADFRAVLPDTSSTSKFFQGVDQLLSGKANSVADAVTRMKRLDSGALFAVRSLMWVVMEMGAALYIKLLVLPLDNEELERDRTSRVQVASEVAPSAPSTTCRSAVAAASPANFFAAAAHRMVKQEA